MFVDKERIANESIRRRRGNRPHLGKRHSHAGTSVRERRAALQELVQRLHEPVLLFSEGVVGPGKAFFAALVAQGQEGMMAKHLASRYRPGRRSAAWRKIKP
jgi:ATP-dependent DNA ligase